MTPMAENDDEPRGLIGTDTSLAVLSDRPQLFFFFQAEDGIRVHCVTGVQTCALPIWRDAQKKLRAVWWTAHDFRRNGRSHLSKVVSPDIAERVLAHVIGGVRAHYDTYQYLDEKRRALQLWAREVERTTSGDGGKIIPMAPRRKRGRS